MSLDGASFGCIHRLALFLLINYCGGGCKMNSTGTAWIGVVMLFVLLLDDVGCRSDMDFGLGFGGLYDSERGEMKINF